MSYKKITKDINSAAPNQHLPAVSAARKVGHSLEVLTSPIHHSANTFAPVLLWSVPLLFSTAIDTTKNGADKGRLGFSKYGCQIQNVSPKQVEQLVRTSSDLLSDQGVKTATVVIENGSLKKRAKVPLTRALLNPNIGSVEDV